MISVVDLVQRKTLNKTDKKQLQQTVEPLLTEPL